MRPSSKLALMAAVLFSTSASVAAPAPMLTSTPRRHGRSEYFGEQAECMEHTDRDTVQVEKQQRSGVQKKRHKAKAFHVQNKPVPSQKVSKFFERVTDPDKEQREAMMAKDPFGRMEGRW